MVKIERLAVGICTCYLIRGERTIMVDAGAPNGRAAFLRGIARLGLEPDVIDLVIVTHGHVDHIGTVQCIKGLTGATVAIHAADAEWMATGRPAVPPRRHGLGSRDDLFGQLAMAADFAASPLAA